MDILMRRRKEDANDDEKGNVRGTTSPIQSVMQI
jgi:hypothetical protein